MRKRVMHMNLLLRKVSDAIDFVGGIDYDQTAWQQDASVREITSAWVELYAPPLKMGNAKDVLDRANEDIHRYAFFAEMFLFFKDFSSIVSSCIQADVVKARKRLKFGRGGGRMTTGALLGPKN